MWETKETLEGGLRIERMWWAVVKAGAIVAVSVLLASAIAFAFLSPCPKHHPERGADVAPFTAPRDHPSVVLQKGRA